ncbi:winged helix-turn-helix transcriptional regulator [Tundrisphaera sp. TA3]|uniref:winged helix-turn-helix transcriptional regulator n=1 Tax=Tundrisphaera sp. TA3 TaxID=3435775 RepID=UPI003EBB32BA
MPIKPIEKAARIVLEEDCAPRRILELFGVKWTTMVLHPLHHHGGMCRTGELARSLPGCSGKLLTRTPREMEADGLLDRKVDAAAPPKVEYSLTPLGRRFVEPLEMLYDWARRNDDAVQGVKKRRQKRDGLAEG